MNGKKAAGITLGAAAIIGGGLLAGELADAPLTKEERLQLSRQNDATAETQLRMSTFTTLSASRPKGQRIFNALRDTGSFPSNMTRIELREAIDQMEPSLWRQRLKSHLKYMENNKLP